jgi:hypothetical protein
MVRIWSGKMSRNSHGKQPKREWKGSKETGVGGMEAEILGLKSGRFRLGSEWGWECMEMTLKF